MPLRRLRAPLLLLLASLAPLGAAPAAHADLGTRPCGDAGSLRCGTLEVPVDRTGAVGGVVGLAFARQPAGAGADEAVVPLAGGPGQAALPFAADFAQSLKPLLAGRELVGGEATAYVCRHYACNLPVTEADALGEQLGG